jgi:hypothetical protein
MKRDTEMEKLKHVVIRDEYCDKLEQFKKVTGLSREQIVMRALLSFEKYVIPQYEKIHKSEFEFAELN